MLGLEISLEVPICSDRGTTRNRRALLAQEKLARGCSSQQRRAAITGTPQKGEGDGSENHQ